MPRLRYKNDTEWVEGVDIFYPVGAVYMSTNETSPAEMFGGTWSALDDGRFLRPMGSYNQQGGSTTHNHWETVGFNANETNAYMLCGRLRTNSRVLTGPNVAVFNKVNNNTEIFWQTNAATTNYRQDTTETTSTLPVYRTVYCWIRTA